MTKPLYRWPYPAHAKAVRQAANANPATRCRRCGLTLTERRRTHPQARWDAGHVIDGEFGSPLAAECSYCNRSAGATAGNLARNSRRTALSW